MNALARRLTTGWNFSRILFVVAGGYLLIDAFVASNWISLVPGVYFLSMGVLAFGCAAGNCAVLPKRRKL